MSQCTAHALCPFWRIEYNHQPTIRRLNASSTAPPQRPTEGHQCVTAAIFWMKTRGGWREAPQSHEIAVKKASEMSDSELEDRIRELETALGRQLLELKPP